MAYVGGLRARLIKDSLYNMLHQALEDLGWFDSGRYHKPLRFPATPVDPMTKVDLNTVALGELGTIDTDAEMGSYLTERAWSMYVDVFAENDTVGLHLARDIQDILQGRFNSIGRTRPALDVYDYTQATPTLIFVCQFDLVSIDRAQSFTDAWQRNWYSVAILLLDVYTDEVAG